VIGLSAMCDHWEKTQELYYDALLHYCPKCCKETVLQLLAPLNKYKNEKISKLCPHAKKKAAKILLMLTWSKTVALRLARQSTGNYFIKTNKIF